MTLLLSKQRKHYIWFGKLCNGDEREMTRVASRILSGRDYELIVEGKEPHEFWINKQTIQKSDKTNHSRSSLGCSNVVMQVERSEPKKLSDSFKKISAKLML